MRTRRRARGMSIVELLVCIGIIVVLVAILLPALSAARRHANQVSCASNLRQITAAVQHHAQDHAGFAPLAGRVVIPASAARPGALPAALNDTERRRYAYQRTPIPTGEAMVPLPAALAPYLGIKTFTFKDSAELSEVFTRHQEALRVFRCPGSSADSRDAGPTMSILVLEDTMNHQLIYFTAIDFAANEGVLGFHYSPAFARRRYSGQLAKVPDSSRVVLFSDAVSHGYRPNSSGGWMFWPVDLDGTGPSTLGDSLRSDVYQPMFPRSRHGQRLNVSFIDGHVETAPISAKALDRVFLLPR